MYSDFKKNKVFTRRAMITGGIKAALMTSLIGRLGYLQLIRSDEYKTQSDSNRIKPFIIPPQRGIIYDRNGYTLSDNKNSYRIFLYLDNKLNPKKTVKKLVDILGLDAQEERDMMGKIRNSRQKSMISILDNLTWNDLAMVEVNSFDLDGISIESGQIRNYPFAQSMSHLIGYVSFPSESEIEKKNSMLFMHPDFRIGKNAIEKSFEHHLRGKAGIRRMEVNAFGIPIRTLSTQKGKGGEDLTLTIDYELQEFAAARIKDSSAAAVVMDINSGEILTMVSTPSFDPNNFVEGISNEYWQELINNPRKPLNNKTISAVYPPGSTFKIVVALAALENGLNPGELVRCTGSVRFGRRTFHCWKEEGHGSVNLIRAIEQSCNSYFYNLAKTMDIDKIASMAQRLGLGRRFDIELASIKSGTIPSRAWKESVMGSSWYRGDTLNAAIGQGFVLATPLQLAVMTARVANGRFAVNPSIIKSAANGRVSAVKSPSVSNNSYGNISDNNISGDMPDNIEGFDSSSLLNIDQNHLKIVRKGMFNVVNSKKGTAYYRRIKNRNFAMSGKTGTSQVISKRLNEEDDEESTPEKHRNHALFIGFAPFKEPKYAISVVVEHGGSGSGAAAPVARDILFEAQRLRV